ncbi:MAG: hypothetical protein AABW46_01635 [Nanoarchaeota archaeon]
MLVIFLSVIVLAVGFSPSSLTFKMLSGKEDCQNIYISSESEIITVTDRWAENKDVDWAVNNFNKGAKDHGITISYPNEINSDDSGIEVCISGEKEGEYHGVILMREEEKTNTVIQLAVWLKVFISNIEEVQYDNGQNSDSSANSGSSSSPENQNEITGEIVNELEELYTEEEQKEKIRLKTGNEEVMEKQVEQVIKQRDKGNLITTLVIGVLILLLITSLIIVKRRKRKWT